MFEREEKDGVAILRLAHGKASALDLELCEALGRATDELADSDARAVVLTGTGSIFSAGVDLFRLIDEGEEYARRFLPALKSGIRRLFELPKPVVAAANGHAIAGGCVLVAACDYRIMARGKGRIGVPELLVGVPFPAMALEVMRFSTPAEHLQEVVYTGATYTPEDALARGLVDEVVDAEELEARALEVARRFGDLRPDAFRLAKRQLRFPTLERVERLAELQDEAALGAWSAPETHAAIRAYLDRTIGKKG